MVFVEKKKHYCSWWLLLSGKDYLGINDTILKVIRCRFKMGITVNRWAHIIGILEGYKAKYCITVVIWQNLPIN